MSASFWLFSFFSFSSFSCFTNLTLGDAPHDCGGDHTGADVPVTCPIQEDLRYIKLLGDKISELTGL
jgi:hypothetical protein